LNIKSENKIITCVIDKYKYCGAIISIEPNEGIKGINPKVKVKSVRK
jgi:hypothetical protein